MQEFFKDCNQRLKKVVKTSTWMVVIILVLNDLDSPGNGYLGSMFSYGFSKLMVGYYDFVEIAQTPLASLTIAKIIAFTLYMIAAKLMWICVSGGCSWIIEKLESASSKEEQFIPIAPNEECARCVNKMQKANSIRELDELLFYVVSKWPQWESQLSTVYKNRKYWLEKNTPTP